MIETTSGRELPAYCQVEGVMNRRTGVGGEEFGISFAIAMSENWNGDFLMQGGGGSNGVVASQFGLNAAGSPSLATTPDTRAVIWIRF
jgi:feruloyl esterase